MAPPKRLFKSEYANEFQGITKSKAGDEFLHCIPCNFDISLLSTGKTAIPHHLKTENTRKQRKLQILQRQSRPSCQAHQHHPIWTVKQQQRRAFGHTTLRVMRRVLNQLIVEFWHRLTLPQVRATNPKMQVKVKMLSDGCRPQFVANLHDGRQVVFKTDGFQLPDLLMRLNRLLGLPARQNGPRQSDPDPLRGEPDEALQQRIPEAQMEAHFRALAKKRKPIDFLS
ncbi:hypothetical protein niasHT_018455 [Heterodera trifolii]|uniref:Uncharacterized protein n=1 Tax=Heterodera trifolii TaxID=157864 RepID=A0ABD2KWF0_9BILA